MNKDMCKRLADIYRQLVTAEICLLDTNHTRNIEDYIMHNDANFQYHGKALGKSFEEAEKGIEEILKHIEHIIAMSIICGKETEDDD